MAASGIVRGEGRVTHYVGTREAGGVLRVWRNGDRPLRHVVHHSPSGFECGYAGSGPADLALSIASDVIGPEAEQVKITSGLVGVRAWNVHQYLKGEIVSGLPKDKEWVLQAIEVEALIQTFEKETMKGDPEHD